MVNLYVAADPLGDGLRRSIVEHLQQNTHFTVADLGVFDKYYEAAHKAAGLVQQSRASGGQDRAVLLCGTGQGMSIIANKYPDVFAACVENTFGAVNAAAINNANVLTLGAKLLQESEAAAVIDAWLSTPFTAGYPEFKEFLQASLIEIPTMLREPPHTHTHSQELLVLSGDKTFTNHSTGTATRLGPWGYSYTPAGEVHSALYHADTVFYIGFEGPMDIFWQDPKEQGIQWVSEEAKAAAEQQTWQPTDGMHIILQQLPKGAVVSKLA